MSACVSTLVVLPVCPLELQLELQLRGLVLERRLGFPDAFRLPLPARRPRATTARPAHPIPRPLRPELQSPRPHHPPKPPTRPPLAHGPTELDAAPQAGVPNRPRTPSPVRPAGAHHRQHRCPRGHPHDSLPSRRAGPPQTPPTGTTQQARAASGTVGPRRTRLLAPRSPSPGLRPPSSGHPHFPDSSTPPRWQRNPTPRPIKQARTKHRDTLPTPQFDGLFPLFPRPRVQRGEEVTYRDRSECSGHLPNVDMTADDTVTQRVRVRRGGRPGPRGPGYDPKAGIGRRSPRKDVPGCEADGTGRGNR